MAAGGSSPPPFLDYNSGVEEPTGQSVDADASSGAESLNTVAPADARSLRSGRRLRSASTAGRAARSTSGRRGGRTRPYHKPSTTSSNAPASSADSLQWEDSPLSLQDPLEKTRMWSTARQRSPETLIRAIVERAVSALSSHNTTVIQNVTPEQEAPPGGNAPAPLSPVMVDIGPELTPPRVTTPTVQGVELLNLGDEFYASDTSNSSSHNASTSRVCQLVEMFESFEELPALGSLQLASPARGRCVRITPATPPLRAPAVVPLAPPRPVALPVPRRRPASPLPPVLAARSDQQALQEIVERELGARRRVPLQKPTPPPRAPRPPSPHTVWTNRVARALMDADDEVLPYKGKKIRSSVADNVKSKAESISTILREGYLLCDPSLRQKIDSYRKQMADICVSLEEQSFDLDAETSRRVIDTMGAGPVAVSSPRRDVHTTGPQPVYQSNATALTYLESSIMFLLDLMSGDSLPDVDVGADVDTEVLREIHDSRIPEMVGNIKELREVTAKYASQPGCDPALITRARVQCERVYRWKCDATRRYRGLHLHLTNNTPPRVPDFQPFDPDGDVSVYEFFASFDEWAFGYLSTDAKAQLLFTKYLSPSLTQSYEEIRSMRKSYVAMKNWLIDEFGSLKATVDSKLRAIREQKVPKPTDDLHTQARYLRDIHRSVSKLYSLEISKGVRVPGLREYMEGNTFLQQFLEVVPDKVQDEWCVFIAEQEIHISRAEGRQCLNKFLAILRTMYTALESRARVSSVKKKIKKTIPKPADSDDEISFPMNHIPCAGAAQQLPVVSKKSNGKKTNKSNLNQGSSKPARWTCLIQNHDDHELGACPVFFESSPNLRRKLCRYQGCWTCLSRKGSGCKREECSRLKTMPTVLVCQDCAVNNPTDNPPPHILMCGYKDHAKPDLKLLGEALEHWIPKFKVANLKQPVVVGFISTNAAARGAPPVSKSAPPSGKAPYTSYDTSNGNRAQVSQRDYVVRPSREEAFFVMQQLNIGGESVLTFYDSGANTHLVEGELAEKVGFTVLDDRCVPISVIGGGQIWTEYGQYACILGPDTNNQYHELECQGLARISSSFPNFDLRPLQEEAVSCFSDGPQMLFPLHVGGDRVRLLFGIKSMAIAPKLHYTLPNGLGVYVSSLVDVYGSNICYGGTHRVFTAGYRTYGINASHTQVLFSQLAQAYMRSPYTSITPDPPPCDHKKQMCVIPSDLWEPTLEEWFASRSQVVPTCEPSPGCSCKDDETCPSPAFCHKAAVPLAKLKGLIDEEDIPAVTDFRCERCQNCPGCKLSSRVKTRSLQEAHEQEVIEKSVTVCLEEAKVKVNLPFVKQPVDFLTERHKGSDNFYQAMRIYRAQCNKPDDVKKQIIAAQADLASRGFMVPLATMSAKTQALIKAAPFRHYFPWRAVYKPGSVSTPVRLVVDPSCTGLNIILAKGENMLTQIPNILVRLRTQRFAWTTDVSKLYNMLYLQDSALPYSLFLFGGDLDSSKQPAVWVMTRAWYGVSSTGNQSGVALERLAHEKRDVFPLATSPLSQDRYVDDIATGADSADSRAAQIDQTQKCLAAGGFSLKFLALSGESPPAKASSDGVSVGCLGLAWHTKEDQLCPQIQSMNLQKKIRGQKAAPERDVTTRCGLIGAFRDGLITKNRVLSRIAEFYDPVGWWEPLRLQLKLSFQELNALDWGDVVPDDQHDMWIEHFLELEKAHQLTIPRCIVPTTVGADWKIRLICLSDAAEGAGGTAIYGGIELPDGSFTCNLLLAKSRVMKQSVPRNELEAILLMADSALAVANALGDRVCEVRYFTDSVVAMCWVLNTRKRLRMYVHNRVQAIRHALRQVSDGEEVVPLYHIEGTANLADLVTKYRRLSSLDLGPSSPWHCGLDWMRQPTKDLPRSQFVLPPDPEVTDIVLEETFKDIELHTIAMECREMLVEPPPSEQAVLSTFSGDSRTCRDSLGWLHLNFDFVHLGWQRAMGRLRAVCKGVILLRHRNHSKSVPADNCSACKGLVDAHAFDMARAAITIAASAEAEAALGKRQLAKRCVFRDGVWISSRRLEKEGFVDTADLDFTPFYDGISIKKVLPVMVVRSRLFHSLLNHIHFREFPHAGVEATLARIKNSFYPIGDARRSIAMVKKACSKCRILLRTAVGLELADLHPLRIVLAPPFYAVMMDIAMGFKAKAMKDSRKSFVAHALVMVCLLTSSTAVYVLDGLATQAVVMALERHASRYGVPGHIFVDAGTQLEKLKDTQFTLRDLTGGQSMGKTFKLTVATPKAHEQQGRVESKIKVVRKMLQIFSDTTQEVNTLLGWETIFARIADHVDNLPIARGSSRAPTDLGWEIITPNRLKLGRNNFRQLDGEIMLDGSPQTLLDRNRLLSERWYDIFVKRIHLLIPRPVVSDRRSLQAGDVVLFVFLDAGVSKMWVWRLGVVVRQVSRSTFEIRYSVTLGGRPKLIERDLRHISLVYGVDEISPMSSKFFSGV